MLQFEVHQLQLAGRHYLLLPKLNPGQMGLLRERFRNIGYGVTYDGHLKARSREGVVHIDPSGLCWSGSDPADAVLPAVPSLLALPKETTTARALARLYYAGVGRRRSLQEYRLLPRIESGPPWAKLRSLGYCGLAPDEHLLASAMLRRSGCRNSLLTDFPVEGSAVRRYGRRNYFVSDLPPSEASSSLRAIGDSKTRNAYLPRDGVLRLAGPLLRPAELSGVFEELGEWCSFRTGE